ncbi:MAG: hypothetical protein SFV53_04030 [Rickettsiales bacterium]|nr:hypothetical protein [Rickettsiales bacterium]
MRNEEILRKTAEGMKESNKVLIRELIRDLEERGIVPVWAIDGEIKRLKIINKNELKDFEHELKEHGLEKSDFCLLEEECTKRQNNALHPITGNIILIHKKSAKLRTYKAGNDSRWVLDFHRDLENKFFSN